MENFSRIWAPISRILAMAIGLVGFIFQVQRGVAAGMIAHDAFEDHDGAILGRLELRDNFRRLDRLSDQRRRFFLDPGACGHRAAADGREKRDFIARGKR